MLVFAASLLGVYGPALVSNMRRAADPYRFNDDARQQVVPFLRFYDRSLFRNDPITDYYLACTPAGYKALYATAARLGVDPRRLSKTLPYLLLGIFVVPVALAAGGLQGKWAAWAAAGLCLGAPVFLSRMSGGLPRSFAFPLYAFAAASLVSGRPAALAVVACAGAAFYPTVAVVAGLSLALMLLLPAGYRGRGATWGKGRRLALVAVTALVVSATTLPSFVAMRTFGAVLRPGDVAAYPEIGPGGRYAEEDRAPDLRSASEWGGFFRPVLAGLGGDRLPAWLFAAGGLAGFVLLARRDVRARRLLVLPFAAVVAHFASIPLSPFLYLPSRYQIYPLGLLAAVCVPAGLLSFGGPAGERRVPIRLAGAAACCAYLLFLLVNNGRTVRTTGLGVQVRDHRRAYECLAALRPAPLSRAGRRT